MTTLIAEDLLLLLLDDDSGKLTGTTYLDTGIGGAVLVELALSGCVEAVKGSGLWARAKVVPTVSDPPSDPLLLEALEVVRAKERTALDLVHKVVDREGLSAREVKKRAKEVAEGDWAAKAVRDSIAAAQAAVTAAIVASTAATTAST